MPRYFAGLHRDLKNVFHDALCEYIKYRGIPISMTLNPVSSVRGDKPSLKKRTRSLLDAGDSIFTPKLCCTVSIITENKMRIENHVIMFTRALPRKFLNPFDIIFERVLRSESSGPKYDTENSMRKIIHDIANASPMSKETGTL